MWWSGSEQRQLLCPVSSLGTYRVQGCPYIHDTISLFQTLVCYLVSSLNSHTSITRKHVESGGMPTSESFFWLVNHEPDLSFEEAYTVCYGPLTPFNANGVTAINLGLNYYQPTNGTAYYKYGFFDARSVRNVLPHGKTAETRQ